MCQNHYPRRTRFFQALVIVGIFYSLVTTAALAATSAKQRFVFNNRNLPSTCDLSAYGDIYSRNVFTQIFEGLTSNESEDLHTVAGAAERWDISDDGLDYTFYLRKGLKWSDGAPLTAQDFVLAWQRVLDPANKAPHASYLYPVKNARLFNSGDLKNADALGVKAINDHVLKVTLENPTGYFLELTSYYVTYPVPSHLIKRHGSKWSEYRNAAFNGPFYVVNNTTNKATSTPVLILKKNPHYWDAHNVRLEEVYIHGIQDSKTALKMYSEGSLDYTGETEIPAQDLPKWRYTSDYRSVPWFGIEFLRVNTVKPPFKNVNVRRAFSLALDKEKITGYLVPVGHQPARSFVPVGTKSYTPPQLDSFDADEARRLLSNEGYCVPKKKEKDCKLFPKIEMLLDNNEARVKLALGVQQLLKRELGISKLQLKIVSNFPTYLKQRSAMAFDLARSGWIGDYNDPNAFLDLWVSNQVNNSTGWINPTYDRLIALAAKEVNPKRRMSHFRKAEKILLDELPVIPIYNFSKNYLIKSYVRNYHDNLQRVLFLKDLYIEHYNIKS